jgi:ABC-type Fe3+-hydroxamate transport system substrate-binding protein
MQFKDQMDTIFELQKTPTRIVCLVPSLTELLVDLGLENSIVGITKFCVHPSGLRKSKTIVGGTKNVHFDKIKSLQPDIILCNKEENTKEIVETCRDIANVHVSNIVTIQDTLNLIHQYGAMFERKSKAKELANEINAKLTDFRAFIKDKTTINVAYFIWKNPWMVAANETFIHHLLSLNNFCNSYEDQKRYPEVDLDHLKRDTELLLLSSEPYPFKDKHIQGLENKYEDVKVVLVDGEYFSWYGSRLLQAFDYFKELRISLT